MPRFDTPKASLLANRITPSFFRADVADIHAAEGVAVAVHRGRLPARRLPRLLQLGGEPHPLRVPVGQFQKELHEGPYTWLWFDMATHRALRCVAPGVRVRRAAGGEQGAHRREQHLHAARPQLGAGAGQRGERSAAEAGAPGEAARGVVLVVGEQRVPTGERRPESRAEAHVAANLARG